MPMLNNNSARAQLSGGQGVVSSNLAAPTSKIKDLDTTSSHKPVA
jgi:hypothetical protein